MDIDIFESEQKIYDEALAHVSAVESGEDYDFTEYTKLINEYGRMLKLLRLATKMSDHTAKTLNTSKHDLLDKVQFDVLTGIYSRRFLEENLKQIIGSISRTGGELSVLMIDIDYFKKYNDTYGHSEGDACLKVIAETLTGALSRASDFAARYGGEEFAIVLPNTNESGARLIADKLLEGIRALNILHENSEVADHVTISIGVTTSEVAYMQTGEDYIKRADEALYMSKQNGRNRYTYIDFKEGQK